MKKDEVYIASSFFVLMNKPSRYESYKNVETNFDKAKRLIVRMKSEIRLPCDG